MSGGTRIARLKKGDPELDDVLVEPAVEVSAPEVTVEEPEEPVRRSWAFAWVLLLSLAWIGAAVGLAWPVLITATPFAIIQFAALLAAPPALLAIVVLLARSTSGTEARRFGATATAMRRESYVLEQRLAQMAAQIEARRVELAEQTASLAGSSLSVTEQVGAIDRAAQRLTDSANISLTTLERLLGQLPAAEAGASLLSGALASAGDTADGQARALQERLETLAAQAQDADSLAQGSAKALAEHLVAMEQSLSAAGERIGSATGDMSSEIDAMLDRTSQAVESARTGVATQGEAMLAMIDANQAALDRASRDTSEALAERIATIEAAVGRIAQQLATQNAAGASLLEQLQAGLDTVDTRVSEVHATHFGRTQELAAALSALAQTAEALTSSLRTGDLTAQGAIGTAETLLTGLDAVAREMDETLPSAFDRLDARLAEGRRTVAAAKPELLALVTAAESTREAISAIADSLHEQRKTVDGISNTLLDSLDAGEGKVAAFTEASDAALDSAARAAERLARQIEAIEAATHAVDVRLETARNDREAADRDTVGRNAGLLIEALNSSAIDITRAMSTEVADSSWAAYLKGDRGVFTRRAVRLLDAGDARDIARLHEEDPEFREQVNRYIHDFEAMLRGILGSREGSALAVTLLSSDMGKLYVALAQAIERLRA